ncbi:HK97 family phage prohead protease [Rhodovibrionaceae bacterium A322]
MTDRHAPFSSSFAPPAAGSVQKLATLGSLNAAAVVSDNGAQDLTLDVTLSTDAPDRDGDRVRLGGWDLENFKRNPVVLWAHDTTLPPVGKVCDLFQDGDSLKARIAFTPKEVNPFGYMTYQLYAGGFLQGVSVGFRPKKWQPLSVEDQAAQAAEGKAVGVDYLQQELLEVSCVPLPANPQALVTAQSQGIDMAPLKHWSVTASERAGSARADLPRMKALVRRELHAEPEPVAGPHALAGPGLLITDDLSEQLILLEHRISKLEEHVDSLAVRGQVPQGGPGQGEAWQGAERLETQPEIRRPAASVSDGEKALAALIARSVRRRIGELSGTC